MRGSVYPGYQKRAHIVILQQLVDACWKRIFQLVFAYGFDYDKLVRCNLGRPVVHDVLGLRMAKLEDHADLLYGITEEPDDTDDAVGYLPFLLFLAVHR